MRLNGKRARVTAAAQGIGRSIAEAFVAQGATVYAADLNGDVLVNGAGHVHAGDILACDEDAFAFSMSLNVTAMYRLRRAFLPGMLVESRA